MLYLTPITFLLLASIMKAIADTLKFHWYSYIFNKLPKGGKLYNWLNPDFAWQNMWKDKYKPLGEKF